MLARRSFLAALATALLAAGGGASSMAADPAGYIRNLGDTAISALTGGDITRDQREASFRTLLSEHFDIPGIGRFVLGRYWNAASEAERAEFLKMFEDLIVQAYSQRFSEYSGEGFEVIGAREDQVDYATVQSQVIRPNAENVRVDWRLRRDNDSYRIVDVMVEGVSMAVTQRAEFASVIQSKGGKVAGLLDVLRKKTQPSGSQNASQ
ncbi:MAG: MlaC/ttg2D family ABC transporter substrate-binding protein [Reyranella sp.]